MDLTVLLAETAPMPEPATGGRSRRPRAARRDGRGRVVPPAHRPRRQAPPPAASAPRHGRRSGGAAPGAPAGQGARRRAVGRGRGGDARRCPGSRRPGRRLGGCGVLAHDHGTGLPDHGGRPRTARNCGWPTTATASSCPKTPRFLPGPTAHRCTGTRARPRSSRAAPSTGTACTPCHRPDRTRVGPAHRHPHRQHWDTDTQLWVAVTDLLRFSPASSALRRALWQIAATIPGVELIGHTTDALGRQRRRPRARHDRRGSVPHTTWPGPRHRPGPRRTVRPLRRPGRLPHDGHRPGPRHHRAWCLDPPYCGPGFRTTPNLLTPRPSRPLSVAVRLLRNGPGRVRVDEPGEDRGELRRGLRPAGPRSPRRASRIASAVAMASRPAAVSVTSLRRRSSGCGRRSTRPWASSLSTIRVAYGASMPLTAAS